MPVSYILQDTGQRAVLKFSFLLLAASLQVRTFTNKIQATILEPQLQVATDPRADHQPHRGSYMNPPHPALCDTDSLSATWTRPAVIPKQ